MKFFDFFRKKPTASSPNTSSITALPNDINLSPALAPYKTQIEKTALPFIRIEATPNEGLSFTQSKFAGKPYWPVSRPYPTDGEGNYMFLLAQLNFSEIPSLEGYPQKGLLQFYISANDGYGLNFDNPTEQTSFRVVYFESCNEEQAEKEFAFLNDAPLEYVPFSKAFRLSFFKDTDFVGSMDVRFRQNFGKDLYDFAESFGEQSDDIGEELCDTFPNDGHKIGGYAAFTQEDPRKYKEEYKDWVLLLQIDTQSPDIMWGDSGVANFFIHPDALKHNDFSNVLYNWDCY